MCEIYSCFPKVACHVSRKVTPNDPAELRSYPTVVEKLLNSCPGSRHSCRHRRSLNNLGHAFAQIGQNLTMFFQVTDVGQFDQNLPKRGRARTSAPRCPASFRLPRRSAESRLPGRRLSNCWRHVRTLFGELRTEPAGIVRGNLPGPMTRNFSATPGPPASAYVHWIG